MAIEWLRKILEGAAITDGAPDVDALESAISKEMPKHTVPKSIYDDVKGKLETAEGQVVALSKVDAIKLQADLETERAARAKDRQEYQLRAALEKAGATDADYLLYKIGDTAKFDEEGKLADAENFIKSVKESHKTMFPQSQDYNPTGGSGTGAVNPWKKDTYNLTQQGQIYKESPAQAKEMMAAAGITQ